LDVSVNSQIIAARVNALSRLLQLHLRNMSSQSKITAFVADASNNKSILTLSAASARKGPSRMKRTPGSEVYPFVTLLRQLLEQRAGQLAGSEDFDLVSGRITSSRQCTKKQTKIDAAENLLVLLDILESRAKQPDFDYSATQLLASWLAEGLVVLPELSEAMPALQGLSSSVEISAGRGQSQIWSLFRTEQPHLSDDLRIAISRVRDPRE
jgi:hypothetical protein